MNIGMAFSHSHSLWLYITAWVCSFYKRQFPHPRKSTYLHCIIKFWQYLTKCFAEFRCFQNFENANRPDKVVEESWLTNHGFAKEHPVTFICPSIYRYMWQLSSALSQWGTTIHSSFLNFISHAAADRSSTCFHWKRGCFLRAIKKLQ